VIILVKFIFLFISRTVLLLLKMVVEYCQCVDDIPSASPDILTRLIELLKVGHWLTFRPGSC
jgi:hypothetical protein